MNSGLLGRVVALSSFTPPLNSGALGTVGTSSGCLASSEGASEGFTPPLNSGALGAVGTSSGCLASPVVASSSFTPPAKSLGSSSPLGTSFKFLI